MQRKESHLISNGLALFSMFFGAGNITFPLMIGQNIQNSLGFALLGLVLTAVFIPFSGLLSISMFNGNVYRFFQRIGRIPGFLIIAFLILLIGPLAGIPRCITLMFSTLKVHFPNLELIPFSLFSLSLIFFACWKKSRIVALIGNILSPMLITLLVVIIFKALIFPSPQAALSQGVEAPFFYGLKEGYNTMDLLAAFFFASLICDRIKRLDKNMGSLTLTKRLGLASLLGAAMMSLVYIGFSFVAAKYSASLAGVPIQELLGRVGALVLGEYGGIVVSLCIALTCLTTAIALGVIASDFFRNQVFKHKVGYTHSLLITVAFSFLVSTLEFQGIVSMCAPILQVLYPALIVFSFLSIVFQYTKLKKERRLAPSLG